MRFEYEASLHGALPNKTDFEARKQSSDLIWSLVIVILWYNMHMKKYMEEKLAIAIWLVKTCMVKSHEVTESKTIPSLTITQMGILVKKRKNILPRHSTICLNS